MTEDNAVQQVGYLKILKASLVDKNEENSEIENIGEIVENEQTEENTE
jgi:hypothetical protein